MIKDFFFFLKVSSKNSHQDETYEVISLESKSEAERKAKFSRLTSSKFYLNEIFL